MRDLMVDLETLGTESNAAIISIGAVMFDFEKGLGDTFYRVVNIESSLAHGGAISGSTIRWWMTQSEEARNVFKERTQGIGIVLGEFSAWLSLQASSNLIDRDNIRVWGNGATFDNVILTNAYKQIGEKRPWSYRGDMCYRTIKNLFPGVEVERVGTHHNALDDAIYQANHLIAIAKHYKLFGAAE